VSEADRTKVTTPRHVAMSWARRLKRVFGVEIESCTRCGGELKIIASIEEPQLIAKILSHLERAERSSIRASCRLGRGAAWAVQPAVNSRMTPDSLSGERAGRGPLVLSCSEGRRGRPAGGAARRLGGPATAKGSAPKPTGGPNNPSKPVGS